MVEVFVEEEPLVPVLWKARISVGASDSDGRRRIQWDKGIRRVPLIAGTLGKVCG